MKTQVCELLGLDFPIFAFSHCRDVVAEVSNAGGLGVLGTVLHSPDELEVDLRWLDANVTRGAYGTDVIFAVGDQLRSEDEMWAAIPGAHVEFVERLRAELGIPAPREEGGFRSLGEGLVMTHERAREAFELCMAHDVALLVSALGPPPEDIRRRLATTGVALAGMVGHPKHVKYHHEAQTDLLIAVGAEAGGHVGTISTMVLVPQIVEAAGGTPVLAAGGIATGRQIAAALALGAQGVWTGSVWLTTRESDVDPVVQRKLLAAESDDAVITRAYTGKPSRYLRTPWLDAWRAPDAPEALPMPLQGLLARDTRIAISQYRLEPLMGTPVGQVVGLMNSQRTVRDVVYSMVNEYSEALDALNRLAR